METTIVYWGYIGIMEKKMESTIVHWGYMGIMEKKMETTITCNPKPQTLTLKIKPMQIAVKGFLQLQSQVVTTPQNYHRHQ